tara:strand:- start:241 stop:657 length:417 start_codon:yes stop_codon:yes gene_type:complete
MGKKKVRKGRNYRFSYLSKGNFTVMNLALILTALVLFSFLIGAKMPTLGKAAYWFDKSVPVCVVGYEGEKAFLFDVHKCCAELQKQLKCDNLNQKLMVNGKGAVIDKKCYVGEGTIQYLINNKQYNYCKKEGYFNYIF